MMFVMTIFSRFKKSLMSFKRGDCIERDSKDFN